MGQGDESMKINFTQKIEEGIDNFNNGKVFISIDFLEKICDAISSYNVLFHKADTYLKRIFKEEREVNKGIFFLVPPLKFFLLGNLLYV